MMAKGFAIQHHCQLHSGFVAGGSVFISMFGPFQCLLSGAGHAIFGLNVYLLCRDGNRKISFLFVCLMTQVTREFRRHAFHSIPSQYTSRKKGTACFIFFLSQLPLLSFNGTNYHFGQQFSLITSMNLFFIFLKGRHYC